MMDKKERVILFGACLLVTVYLVGLVLLLVLDVERWKTALTIEQALRAFAACLLIDFVCKVIGRAYTMRKKRRAQRELEEKMRELFTRKVL